MFEREGEREPALYLFFNFPFMLSVYIFSPLLFLFYKKAAIGFFFSCKPISPSSGRMRIQLYSIKTGCREKISSRPFRLVYKSPPRTSSLSELITPPPFFLTHTVHLPTQRLLPPFPRPLFYLFSALSLSPYHTPSPPLFLPQTSAEVRSHCTRHRHHGRHPTRY